MNNKFFKNIIEIKNINDTYNVAKFFFKIIDKYKVIHLSGDIGSGKTTFIRYLIQLLGYNDYIKSPTFSVFERYKIHQKHIIHMDLYKINNHNDILYLDIEEYIEKQYYFFIEWAEKGSNFIPQYDIKLTFINKKISRLLLIEYKKDLINDKINFY